MKDKLTLQYQLILICNHPDTRVTKTFYQMLRCSNFEGEDIGEKTRQKANKQIIFDWHKS